MISAFSTGQGSLKKGQVSLSCGASILNHLRRQHGVKWKEQVAFEAGVSVETLKKLEERGGSPSIFTFLKLVDAYGAPLLAVAFNKPPDWLSEAALKHEIEILLLKKQQIEQKLQAVAYETTKTPHLPAHRKSLFETRGIFNR